MNGTQKALIQTLAKRLIKSVGSERGGVMPEIENFQDSAEHCFEVAKQSDFPEEEIALEAFGLLTANNYDRILGHALGVSL